MHTRFAKTFASLAASATARRLGYTLVLFSALLGIVSSSVVAEAPHGSSPSPKGASGQVTLTVFAAASLTDAFQEIGQRFESENAGVKVVFNFAGSQVLSQQLGQGAAADVFASANQAQMEVAAKSGRVTTSQVFARNRLVVIYPAGNPGKIKDLKDLTRPGVQLVLAAKTVPVGQYALDFLDKASGDPAFGAAFKTDVLQNVVSYEDNVKAVVAKVALGEADAGIVYNTDIVERQALNVTRLDIPDAFNTVAAYPLATVDDGLNPAWAKAFVRFVLSKDGQQILANHGFIPNWPSSR
jgi:molybdate transport system substrate-binding protein